MGIFKTNQDVRKEALEIREFAHARKNQIVIVADPKDDRIFVGYNDRFVTGRIKTEKGDSAKILQDMMKSSALFDSHIDRFLMGLSNVMRFRKLTHGVNNFLQFLDGALYNISQRHREKTKTSAKEKGLVKSPIQMRRPGSSPGPDDSG